MDHGFLYETAQREKRDGGSGLSIQPKIAALSKRWQMAWESPGKSENRPFRKLTVQPKIREMENGTGIFEDLCILFLPPLEIPETHTGIFGAMESALDYLFGKFDIFRKFPGGLNQKVVFYSRPK